jgi:metallo-beta-lactamase family protein
MLHTQRPAVPLLRFLGATETVTGSRFLVDTPHARVLVDCGLFQGLKELRLRNWAPFPVDPASLDAIVLTHAHLDHTGYVPALARNGFKGLIFCTENTHKLCRIVLPDSGHLQEEEALYANRRGFSKHVPALPLYTEEDARRVVERFTSVAFDTPIAVAPGVRAIFRQAGHILGSSSIRLELEGKHPRTLTFSGDLGRPQHPLLCAPAPLSDTNMLVIESTYGDRRHEDVHSLERFEKAIVRTAGRGGMVIIPSFAVDRTEVILFHLKQLIQAQRVPKLPIYVDSPMALSSLEIYRRAIAEKNAEIRPELCGDSDPFNPGRLFEARTVEQSMAINEQRVPSIIISAAGMATGGRVLHHLARRLPDPRNTVILVGFQTTGTRGRSLLDGARSVKMLGRYVPVRAEIIDVPAFSVHADKVELLAWLKTAPTPPEIVYVVHGEKTAADALHRAIEQELDWNAAVPRYLEQVRLD